LPQYTPPSAFGASAVLFFGGRKGKIFLPAPIPYWFIRAVAVILNLHASQSLRFNLFYARF
jgi:hypothetical protein